MRYDTSSVCGAISSPTSLSRSGETLTIAPGPFAHHGAGGGTALVVGVPVVPPVATAAFSAGGDEHRRGPARMRTASRASQVKGLRSILPSYRENADGPSKTEGPYDGPI